MSNWTFPRRLPRRYRPRPWSLLTDAEYAALRPYTERDPGPGRPLRDPRGRLDAIFRICLTNTPWTRISTDHGQDIILGEPGLDGCSPSFSPAPSRWPSPCGPSAAATAVRMSPRPGCSLTTLPSP